MDAATRSIALSPRLHPHQPRSGAGGTSGEALSLSANQSRAVRVDRIPLLEYGPNFLPHTTRE